MSTNEQFMIHFLWTKLRVFLPKHIFMASLKEEFTNIEIVYRLLSISVNTINKVIDQFSKKHKIQMEESISTVDQTMYQRSNSWNKYKIKEFLLLKIMIRVHHLNIFAPIIRMIEGFPIKMVKTMKQRINISIILKIRVNLPMESE